MDRLTEVLALGRKRAGEMKLSYAGALTPTEVNEVLSLEPRAKLVDVRTRAELDWVGRVPGALEVELLGYPGNALNALFAQQLEAATGKDSLLLLMCRSGGRSNMAATQLTALGFSQCYNMLEGFEGDRDASGQRNRMAGWRAAGLAWQQS